VAVQSSEANKMRQRASNGPAMGILRFFSIAILTFPDDEAQNFPKMTLRRTR